MLWALILQLLALVQNVLTRLVGVEYHFTQSDILTGGDGQWTLTNYSTEFTDKGMAVTNALATIIHAGLDFVAQFMLLLPAASSTTYNTSVPSSFYIP